MTRPAVGDETARVYGLLPGAYRDEDEEQAAGVNGWPLLRYLSTLLDQASLMAVVADRVAYLDPTDGPLPTVQAVSMSDSDAGTGSGAKVLTFSTPSAGFDARVRWEFPVWPPPTNTTLIGQYDSASGNNRAWLFTAQSDGLLRLIVSADGTAVPQDVSSVAPTFPDAGPKIIDLRTTWDDATNASHFYTRPAGRRLPLTAADGWEELGVAGTIASAGIFASTAPLQVGAFNAGTGENQDGYALDAAVLNLAGDTVLAHLAPWDVARWQPGTTSAEGPDGRAWLLNSESAIVDRTLYNTSALTDPQYADDAWLDWLAQLVGVDGTTIITAAEKRQRIGDAASGWLAGTPASLRAAVQTVLTGTKLVILNRHFGGNVWAIEIQTDNSETPGGGTSVLTAAAAAKPAGVLLSHSFISGLTWTNWETLSTWTAIEAEGTWDQLQDV